MRNRSIPEDRRVFHLRRVRRGEDLEEKQLGKQEDAGRPHGVTNDTTARRRRLDSSDRVFEKLCKVG